MRKFKTGDTVFAVKGDNTPHKFGFVDDMETFANGATGTVVYLTDNGYGVRVTGVDVAYSYDESELSATPRGACAPVSKTPKVTKAAIRTKKVLAKAPKKVYAVVKGQSVHPTASRQQARDLKSILGGKAEGAIIVRYDITEEIR